MDINNDKDTLNETEEVSDKVVTEDAEVTEVTDDNIADTPDTQEEEVSVEKEIFDEELENSENFSEELAEDPTENATPEKKTFPIQKSVFVALIAFLLTAVIIFGSFIVYDIIEKNKEELTVVGVWAPAEGVDSGYYYIFEDDGAFSVNIGGQVLSGTYTTEDIESENAESESYQVITITPCVFSDYESQATVTLSEDKNTLTLTFIYSGSVSLVRTELPEYKLDANNITHASADEVGLDVLNTDESIVGSWSTEDYTGVKETYTFYADGTGKACDEFVEGGYSITTNFKYTTKDGKIYLSIELYNGNTSDGELSYYIDNGKLILNNFAYEAEK